MKYAMALGGGGARGAFEAGVWKGLCELGIGISAIAGTSVGAINGAAFAAGADVCQLWRNINISDIVGMDKATDDLLSLKGIMSVISGKFCGGLDTAPMKKMILEYISEDKVRKSAINFGLCTYSVSEGKSKELFVDEIEYGYLADYIAASACFPVFRPQIIKGEEFSDGGLRNNIPINMLTQRGYDNIIAVSVRGWGLNRDYECGGVNIVNVEIPPECGGLMEFDSDAIEKSLSWGYIAIMRAFGHISGNKYAFNSEEYKSILSVFGKDFADNIEVAAHYLKLPDFLIYTFSTISDLLIKGALKDKKVKKIIDIIRNSDSRFIKEKIDLLGEIAVTASVAVYLINYRERMKL